VRGGVCRWGSVPAWLLLVGAGAGVGGGGVVGSVRVVGQRLIGPAQTDIYYIFLYLILFYIYCDYLNPYF
jgi:hypothetical protein